jgi:hypothetical protein
VESFLDHNSLQFTHQETLNAKLDELATPEVLAITRPPAAFPVPVPHHEQKATRATTVEVERLRRHLLSSQSTLTTALKERDTLTAKLQESQACTVTLYPVRPDCPDVLAIATHTNPRRTPHVATDGAASSCTHCCSDFQWCRPSARQRRWHIRSRQLQCKHECSAPCVGWCMQRIS